MAFQDIELEWDGEIYVIQAHRVMGAISRIEEFITLPELNSYTQRGGAPIGRLSQAYCSVLKYAGARVTDSEVYERAFATGDGDNNILMAITNIMQIMLPPSVRKRLDENPTPAAAPSQTTAAAQDRTTASSKPRIRPRSRKANG